MIVYVDWDEMYPVYSCSTKRNWSGDIELEITDEEYAFIKAASINFYDAQRILERARNEYNKILESPHEDL